jgi:hypothetical protein
MWFVLLVFLVLLECSLAVLLLLYHALYLLLHLLYLLGVVWTMIDVLCDRLLELFDLSGVSVRALSIHAIRIIRR